MFSREKQNKTYSTGSRPEYTVSSPEDLNRIGSNRILGDVSVISKSEKADIVFCGEKNVLYLEEGIKLLRDVRIRFEGDGSIIYISRSRSEYSIAINAESNAVCFISPYLFTNKSEVLNINIRKDDFVIIGTDCMYSLGITIDTSSKDNDRHGDVLVGNHVWLGQNTRVYGNTIIDSGAVIGANTTLNGDHCSGNACWATRKGVLTKLRDGIVFEKDSMRSVPYKHLAEFDRIDQARLDKTLQITSTDPFELARKLRPVHSTEKRLNIIIKFRKTIVNYQAPLIDMSGFYYHDGDKAVTDDRGNRIIGEYYSANKIVFKGSGNILYIEKGAELRKCRIVFKGDNSLVYLRASSNVYRFSASMHYDTTLFCDGGIAFSPKERIRIILSESRSILLGKNVTIGSNVWMRTSDQHPIYNIKSLERINPGRDIIVHDNAVIDDDSLILKGSKINQVENGYSCIQLEELSLRLAGGQSADERLRTILTILADRKGD